MESKQLQITHKPHTKSKQQASKQAINQSIKRSNTLHRIVAHEDIAKVLVGLHNELVGGLRALQERLEL